MSIGVCLSGALGRMGRAIAALAQDNPGVELICGIELKSGTDPLTGVPIFQATVEAIEGAKGMGADVLLIFVKEPADAVAQAEAAACKGMRVVIGTTGFSSPELGMLKAASAKVALFQAYNFSVGVNVMIEATRMLAALMPGHHIDVLDEHHAGKVDCPRGTAIKLLQAACHARGLDFETAVVYDHPRHREGPRGNDEIGVQWTRAGEIPGNHQATFAGPGEVLRVSHGAINRGVFAAGVLKAVEFTARQEPGVYGMADLLGLPSPDEFLAFLRQRQ